MPANLTVQYRRAETAYRIACTPEEELRCLQWMLRELPKHKGTDKLHAELKRKISKARLESGADNKKSMGLRIPSQGAGRVVLIGGPNCGKSSLLAALTRATPEVADYPFSTREPSVGMLHWEDIAVQLVDTPPITRDYMEVYMQGLIRGADLVWLVVDGSSPEGLQLGHDVLEHLDQTKTRLAAESRLDENDVGRSYTRSLLVANKSDTWQDQHPEHLLCTNEPSTNPVPAERLRAFEAKIKQDSAILTSLIWPASAVTQTGLDALCRATIESMDLVRVYTKHPQEREVRKESPLTIRKGETVLEVASQIHEDMVRSFKFARVWGVRAHPGTRVKADYVPDDGDIVEFHLQ